jgi:hypothetical protein
MRVGLAAAAVVSVIVLGKYLVRPALRLIARTDIREVFTAFALLLVIGIAELMQLAGVSMALGALPRRRASRRVGIPPRARKATSSPSRGSSSASSSSRSA